MNLQSHELRESVKFRNLLKVKFGSHGARRFPERGDSRTSKKQSQKRRLKKSGVSVWTSGRLVNLWDEKDIHVCVHIRNILRARRCFRNVKVPSSPYKRGARARVNGLTTLKVKQSLRRFIVYSSVIALLERAHWIVTRVRGSHPDIRIPPNSRNTQAQTKSRCKTEIFLWSLITYLVLH
jgi:predicted RNA binding protein YcfA (HicA-like mRNA interferase family)